MAKYAITREVNNKEFYLENMYSDKVIWVTNKTQALTFEREIELKEFIRDTFPGKDYYSSPITKTSLIYIP